MKNLHFFALIAIFIFTTSSLFAQQKLGLRLEYGIQNVKSQNAFQIGTYNRVDYELTLIDITPAQSIGLYAYKSFGNLFIQPEFLYTSYSVQYSVLDFTDSRSTTKSSIVTERIQQFDIPIYAGVQFNSFRIGAGPVFHIEENIDSSLDNYDNITINPTKLSAGLQLGLGYNFKFVAVDLKYNRDFNQVSDHISFENRSTGITSSINSIRLGIAFAIGQ